MDNGCLRGTKWEVYSRQVLLCTRLKRHGRNSKYRGEWEGGGLRKIVIEFPANSGGYMLKLGLSMTYFLKEHL